MNDRLFEPDAAVMSQRFVGARGADADVHLYVVGEAPGYNEDQEGLPFVGPAGQMLDAILTEAGADLLRVRFYNAVPYRPIKVAWAGAQPENRPPTPEEIELYSAFVKRDIRKHKPKVIVLAGRSALLAFGIRHNPGESRGETYTHEGIPVVTTWHPSYVLRNGGVQGRAYGECVLDVKRAWNVPSPIKQVNLPGEVVDVLDWDRVEAALADETATVLDYEASGLNKYHKGFHLGGVALQGLESGRAFYVHMYDFWRTPEEFKIPAEIMVRIGDFLESKRQIVFNLQYEAGATLTVFNRYLRNITDVMMFNRMLGGSGGLKDLTQVRLNVPKWNSDVDEWVRIMEVLQKQCRPTHKGTLRHEIVFLREGAPRFNLPAPTTFEEVLAYFEMIKEPKARDIAVWKAFQDMNAMCCRYYQDERKVAFIRRFFDLLFTRTQARDIDPHYTDIPLDIIASYALLDVGHTRGLYGSFTDEITEKGLQRAAVVYNDHARLGFEVESAGLAWNDEMAGRLDKVYYNRAVECLRSLLMVPKFSQIIELSTQDTLKIQTTQNLDDLTKYFNPRSTHETTKENFSVLLITGRVKFMRMLYEIFKEWSNRPAEECAQQFPVLWPVIEQIIAVVDLPERVEVIEMMTRGAGRLAEKIMAHPYNKPDRWKDKRGRPQPAPEVQLMQRFANWDFPNMSAETFEDIYESFAKIGGVDIDNKDTWIYDEFHYLIDFRIYKKVMKSYSAYIWGEMGRAAVARISTHRIHELRQRRVSGHTDELPNDQLWLSETSWGVCTAITKRWQSGTHTVPGDSELLDLRVSRFADGMRIHYDYSQNEVRVMARLANEENLLQAFRDGLDVHDLIASYVWRKPVPEVSPSERQFSKRGTFAILYGDTPEGFARKFMNGDVVGATQIFERIYTAFPGIKGYISSQHRLALNGGLVYSVLGDPLNVNMPYQALACSDDEKEALIENIFSNKVNFSDDPQYDKKIRFQVAQSFRNAQNYPIQNFSSMLAGLGIQYMTDFMRDREMTARVDCFTHDAGDIDSQIADIPMILKTLPETSMQRIEAEFDMPVKTDFDMGLGGNTKIKLDKMVCDDRFVKATYKGRRDSVEAIQAKLQLYGVKCDFTIDTQESKLKSMGELFMAKKAFAMSLGTVIDTVKGKLELDFTNVQRL